MRIEIRHVTRFRFEAPVNYSIHDTRLQPVPGDGQRLLAWRVSGPGRRHDWIDGYGNAVATFSLAAAHDEIEIVAEGICDSDADAAWIAFPSADALPPSYWLLDRGLARFDPAMQDLVADLRPACADNAERLPALHRLAARIADRIAYVPGSTAVDTSAAAALALGQGVCQDHAHVFIACCRGLEVPARYASGYLRVDVGHNVGSASHGWAEAWVEGLGWVGFDPANRCSPMRDYVRLAVGPDYAAAAPVTGRRVGSGSASSMSVEVMVRAMG